MSGFKAVILKYSFNIKFVTVLQYPKNDRPAFLKKTITRRHKKKRLNKQVLHFHNLCCIKQNINSIYWQAIRKSISSFEMSP